MTSTRGFKALTPKERERLKTYTSGKNPLSKLARLQLLELVKSGKYERANAPGQAKMLRAFMADPPNDLVNGVLTRARPSQPHTVSAPVDVAAHPFASGTGPAQRYDVQVGNRTVPVFVAQPAAKDAHSVAEVARALSTMPGPALAAITQVQLNSGPNPADAYWAKEYGMPGFTSYMTAGAAGIIDVYPVSPKQPPAVLANSLVHEVGHIVSGRAWGNPDDPRWEKYRDAIRSDRLQVSDYGGESPGEDFSEFLSLYAAFRGTPQEAELRRMFPARFAVASEAGLLV